MTKLKTDLKEIKLPLSQANFKKLRMSILSGTVKMKDLPTKLRENYRKLEI
jgi:hypothetical protein